MKMFCCYKKYMSLKIVITGNEICSEICPIFSFIIHFSFILQ